MKQIDANLIDQKLDSIAYIIARNIVGIEKNTAPIPKDRRMDYIKGHCVNYSDLLIAKIGHELEQLAG